MQRIFHDMVNKNVKFVVDDFVVMSREKKTINVSLDGV